MSETNVIHKESLFRLKEHMAFANTIYQSIVDEWLLEAINVKRAKNDLKENQRKHRNRKMVHYYSIEPKEIMKRAYEKYGTHTFAIPSIGLYLFPQTQMPFHSLFKSTNELFKVGHLMQKLKSNSSILPKMRNVFYEHGLMISTDVLNTGELRVEVRYKEL